MIRSCMMILVATMICQVAMADDEASVKTRLVLSPVPAKVEMGEGSFTLTGGTTITVNESVAPVIRYLKENLLPEAHLGDAGQIDITTRGADASLGDEGYELTVEPHKITIKANKPAGAFYGVQTLRQLLPADVTTVTGLQKYQIPSVKISDKPRFAWRGYMLDSCRHIQSVEFIKRTIDRLAYHKINTFHWHLSEDQGWRIEIKKYPRLTDYGAWRDTKEKNAEGQWKDGKYGGFYTQDQIREIVKYAADRYINAVPEIDMPGHMIAAIASYPELACFPDKKFEVRTEWGISEDVLCPGKESTFEFTQNVLLELMDLFPSKVIHLGGDECPRTRWKTCPNCQARIKSEGLANEDALQNYFTRRMMKFLEDHGRRMMGWNEIMKGGKLPPEVIVHQWNDPKVAVAAVKDGNDVVDSITTYCYFDYDYRTTPLAKVYKFDPMPDGLTPEEARHILGGQANLWTEWKPTELGDDQFTWPRMIAMAEVLWSPKEGRNYDEFLSRMGAKHYDRLANLGLGKKDTPKDDIKAYLESPGSSDMGKAIGTWAPHQMSEQFKTMEWDATRFMRWAGDYVFNFNFDSGAHGAMIKNVTLLASGQEIAKDAHEGWAGAGSHDNTYTLKLDKPTKGAKYTIRAEIRSDGGTDSSGTVYVKQPARPDRK
ncbi:MAG TPA: beta-N-acetylhexosaminidase [Tepidisphaeraceae bacterium]|nr:beta-N-acetylhexosaminidase [Tepidisphaeraceae bacterium]